jgi:hypothetical protein
MCNTSEGLSLAKAKNVCEMNNLHRGHLASYMHDISGLAESWRTTGVSADPMGTARELTCELARYVKIVRLRDEIGKPPRTHDSFRSIRPGSLFEAF